MAKFEISGPNSDEATNIAKKLFLIRTVETPENGIPVITVNGKKFSGRAEDTIKE